LSGWDEALVSATGSLSWSGIVLLWICFQYLLVPLGHCCLSFQVLILYSHFSFLGLSWILLPEYHSPATPWPHPTLSYLNSTTQRGSHLQLPPSHPWFSSVA
jgi:hypothetical protein